MSVATRKVLDSLVRTKPLVVALRVYDWSKPVPPPPPVEFVSSNDTLATYAPCEERLLLLLLLFPKLVVLPLADVVAVVMDGTTG